MCLFTLDLSEALDKHVFYDCLLSTLLKVAVLWMKVAVLWIYKFDISYTQLVSDGKSTIFLRAFHEIRA